MRKVKKFLVVLVAILFTACSTNTETWQEKYDLGMRYLTEGNYEEAILSFTAAIEIDPKMPEAYVGMADAYIGLGEYDKAIEILQKGMENANNSEMISDKLEELQNKGDLQEGQAVGGSLQLSDITYYYEEGGQLAAWNEGAVGGMRMDFTVTGPENVASVLIASWSDIPFSQEEVNSLLGMMVDLWKEDGINSMGSVPFEVSSMGHPVEPYEKGTTQYVLLVGLDKNGEYVGYSVVAEQIP